MRLLTSRKSIQNSKELITINPSNLRPLGQTKMASSCITKNLRVLLIVLLGTILLGSTVKAQAGSCSVCKPDECCSQYGYCGKNASYCGEGCQAGPCLNPTNGVSVGDLVTQQFFDGIANKGKANNKDCPGQNFYSRGVFLEALKSYPRFGRTGSVDDSKREIAAFFAHITHESGCKFFQTLDFLFLQLGLMIRNN